MEQKKHIVELFFVGLCEAYLTKSFAAESTVKARFGDSGGLGKVAQSDCLNEKKTSSKDHFEEKIPRFLSLQNGSFRLGKGE